MKHGNRLIALSLSAALALGLTACGGGGDSGSGPASEEAVFRQLYSQEVTTFNYLYTGNQNDFQMSANCVDCLVEYVHYGVMIPSLAESWEPNAAST